MKKNNSIDIAGWGLVLVILLATPFIVNLFYTPPEIGPDKNPTVLLMVLTLLSLIAMTTVGLYGLMVLGKTRSLADRGSLSQSGLNMVNIHNKLIGGLFIVSGFIKLQDPLGFSYKLDDYWSVFADYSGGFFPETLFKSLSVPMAMGISVFEVVLAFALLTAYRMRWASTLAFLMMLFFTFLTGFSAITGAVTDCGCFGDALKFTPMQSFLKDILLTLATLPIWLLRKRIKPFYRTPIPLALTVISGIVFGIISYHTLQHLPLLDFRGAYKVGQNLQYNSENIDPETDGYYAHDFYEFCKECGKGDGYEGASLYIVAYNIDKYNPQDFADALTLTKELAVKAPRLKVCTGSNSGSVSRKKLGLEDVDELGFSPQDEKTLKTIIRSSPGYILVKDAVVMKKWHHNDRPSAEELIGLAGNGVTIPLPPPPPPPLDSLTLDSLRLDSLRLDSLFQDSILKIGG